MEYLFEGKAKRNTFILMGVGILLFIIGAIASSMGHHEGESHGVGQRLWVSILVSGFFFFGVSLAALFFLALQYAAEAGWAVVFKRVMEGIMAYLPVGALTLMIVFLMGSLHFHHIYHWMDMNLYDVNHEDYDQLIAHKQPYLNQIFWWIRTIAYLGIYILFMRAFRKRSMEEDQLGSENEKAVYIKNQTLAAIFLVIFGYTSTTFSWDWIMSIDTHWFSTIFGWYIFSGMWISGLVMITLITIYLRSKGLMEFVNDSHMHDIGKWVFGVSFLWTYLFFCQFMLYWYSNIPEEITYFLARINDYTWIFWGTMAVNFIFPMLLLMSKDAKRNAGFMVFVGCIIFFGHWMDVFMIVSPGAIGPDGTIGLVEIGSFIAFLGLFLFVVLGAISKRPLLVKNHPYLEESLHHHIN